MGAMRETRTCPARFSIFNQSTPPQPTQGTPMNSQLNLNLTIDFDDIALHQPSMAALGDALVALGRAIGRGPSAAQQPTTLQPPSVPVKEPESLSDAVHRLGEAKTYSGRKMPAEELHKAAESMDSADAAKPAEAKTFDSGEKTVAVTETVPEAPKPAPKAEAKPEPKAVGKPAGESRADQTKRIVAKVGGTPSKESGPRPSDEYPVKAMGVDQANKFMDVIRADRKIRDVKCVDGVVLGSRYLLDGRAVVVVRALSDGTCMVNRVATRYHSIVPHSSLKGLWPTKAANPVRNPKPGDSVVAHLADEKGGAETFTRTGVVGSVSKSGYADVRLSDTKCSCMYPIWALSAN